MWRINQAVSRILTLKFKLGLFDHPYVNPTQADTAVTANADLARQAADESMTLLRNQNNALPLSAGSKVVVTGPNADSVTNLLGGQASAVAQAGSTDAYVAVVGEKQPYAEGLGDDPAPQLTADQKSLISGLEATGKPVIVVAVAGRPLGFGPGDNANAVLMAYLPGTQGGNGVADMLFGKYNPSGKLSVTWPSDAAQTSSGFNPTGPTPPGDEPKFSDQLAGTNSGWGSGYNPLYPFGFGLSYTTFSTTDLAASGPSGATVTARFTVSNTGNRDGADVVPVYVHRAVDSGGILTPSQQLVGFTRVQLTAGQQKTVSVSFPTSELALTPGDIDGTAPPRVQPGSYQVQVGSDSVPITIH